MRIWPEPTLGSGTSSTRRLDGPVSSWTRTARMPRLYRDRAPRASPRWHLLAACRSPGQDRRIDAKQRDVLLFHQHLGACLLECSDPGRRRFVDPVVRGREIEDLICRVRVWPAVIFILCSLLDEHDTQVEVGASRYV